jgi:DNA-directed RNA polymerase subunit RPC12/RpoP
MVEPEDDEWWKHGRPPDEFEDADEEIYGSEEDEDPVIPCPNCGEEVFDDAEQCPSCGHWLVPDRSPMKGRPSWFLILGFGGAILAILLWLVWR